MPPSVRSQPHPPVIDRTPPARVTPPVRAARDPLAELCSRLAVLAGGTTLLALAAAVAAPPDAVQGQWQRLMYLHVPAAWTGYLAFAAVAGFSLAHLRGGRAWWDRCAQAAAEVGVVATGLTLISGSVWGRAVWGVWWAWDPRLVSTAAMFATYLAYLGLRGLGGDILRLRRRVAVLGVVAALTIPLVHFSVVWWAGLHQQATLLGPPTRTPPLDPRMAVALGLALTAASCLGLYAFVRRVHRPVLPRTGRR